MAKLFVIIAAIIHIGDIDLIEDDSDLHMTENSKVNNFQQLQIIASLLNVNAKHLSDALTTSSNVTRGETIIRKNTVEKSLDCRNAMAKALYGALFSWIVNKINQLLVSEKDFLSEDYMIGILDIFGFENVHHNSFEQLFINIANEQIQHYFNQYIFTMEMNEYQKEGISTSQIKIKDNKHMLDLFLQRPMGLLALLDEESGFPKATDATLIDKFNSNIGSDCYIKLRGVTSCFNIKHYAGEVTYDARGFLEKNRDRMSPDIINVLKSSANTLLRTYISQSILLSNDFQTRPMNTTPYRVNNRDKYGSKDSRSLLVVSLPTVKSTNSVSRRQQTLSMTFRNSLEDLLFRLSKADPHFVRCIKPNDKKMANQFDQDRVMTQLRYTGVLETTRLRKEGYSERITFKEFVRRYQLVLFHLKEKVRPDALTCKAILRAAGLEQWLVGKTKIFLKYYHVEKLATILEKYRHSVILVQRAVRTWLQRRHFKLVLDRRTRSAIVLQKVYRGRIVRRKYGHILNKRTRNAIIIQTAVRRWFVLRKYKIIKEKREKCAIILQAAYRGLRDRRVVRRELEIRREKQETAAKKITAVARGFQGRREFERLKEQSSQMETKMIYFLQQVPHLGDMFHGTQQSINKPVSAQLRTGATQELVPQRSTPVPNSHQHYGQQKKEVSFEIPHNNERKYNIKSAVTSHQHMYKDHQVKKKSVAEPNRQYKKAAGSITPTRKLIKIQSETKRNSVTKIDTQIYKINPLIADSQRETLSEENAVENDAFMVDTSQLRYSGYRATEIKPTGNAWRSGDAKNESSNVLLVHQTSNVGHHARNKNKRRKNDQALQPPAVARREVAHLSETLTECTEVPYNDIRAKLRKTGQIERNSGLHKIEIARQHSQRRVIDVK